MAPKANKAYVETGLEDFAQEAEGNVSTSGSSDWSSSSYDALEAQLGITDIGVANNESVTAYYRLSPAKGPTKYPQKVYEKGWVFRGEYLRTWGNVTKRGTAYTHFIRLEDGKLVGLNGTTSLNREIGKYNPGHIVIRFEGMRTTKNGTDFAKFSVIGANRKAE